MKSNSSTSLPNDIIIEILSRLPVKPLIRFRCVCKNWKSLITSDHSFIRSHLKFSINKTPGSHSNVLMHSRSIGNYGSCSKCKRIVGDPELQRFTNASEKSLHQSFYVGENFILAGCSNGVLCFYKLCHCCSSFAIYLWNPALHQCRTLESRNCSTLLNISVGFGFDPLSDDYKVVKIFGAAGGFKKIELYSLKNDSWKVISFNFLTSGQFIIRYNSIAVILNGAAHWIAFRGRDWACFLNIFDMNREEFREILIPNCRPMISCPQLGVFRGSLSMSGWTGEHKYEVWVMKEYGVESSWTRLFAFSSDLCIFPLYSFSSITRSGKILANFQGCIVLYSPEDDPEGKKTEFIQNEEVSFHTDTNYFLADYAESLVSIFPPNDSTRKNDVQLENSRSKKEETEAEDQGKTIKKKFANCFRRLFGFFVTKGMEKSHALSYNVTICS